MSVDVLEQLSAYGTQHREAQAPITLAEVVTEHEMVVIETTPTDRPNEGRNRRRVAGLSAAAAAVVIVVGIVAVRSDDGDPEGLETADVTAADETVLVPEPTVPIRARPIVPADAVEEPIDGAMQPTHSTPLPDFANAADGDDGPISRPLPIVDAVPSSDRLDFLRTFCRAGVCFRDAVISASDGGAFPGEWIAGQPFHIRHGFVNEGDEPLPAGFDLAVYVFPMDDDVGGVVGGGVVDGDRVASGPTQRFHTDYVVREATDACGPAIDMHSGTVSCEAFVHEFDDGLPAGRWALWAVWEAPCSAWVELSFTEACADPDEIVSFFSSGVDSPVLELDEPASSGAVDVTTPTSPDDVDDVDDAVVAGEPTVTEIGEWTRVDGLGLERVFGDGTSFYGITAAPEREVLRSVDGIEWEFVVEAPWWDVDEPLPAVRDGRLVAVDADRPTGTVITVHLVEADGSYRQQEVVLEGPPGYEPFLRRDEWALSVNILENGRIVINTRYYAHPGMVRAAARALLAERFGVAVDDVVVTDIPSATGVVEVLVAGTPREITVADLGLEPWWEFPREVAIVSDDGTTWTQLDGPDDIRLFERVEPMRGGLASFADPRVVGSTESGLFTSIDGVAWARVTANSGFLRGRLDSAQNRSFARGAGTIWEVTAEGLVLVADSATSPELLRMIMLDYHPGVLTVGGAGTAYVDGVDSFESTSEGGIRYSFDDGLTWTFEPFPDSFGRGSQLAVGTSAAVLVDFDESRGPAVWVRELSG